MESMDEKKIAVVKLGGKQHVVTEGKRLVVNRIKDDIGVIFSLTNELNQQPVQLKILAHSLGEKINGLKFKSKSRYLRRYGHRQQQSVVEVLNFGTPKKNEEKKEVSLNTKSKSKVVKKTVKAKPISKAKNG